MKNVLYVLGTLATVAIIVAMTVLRSPAEPETSTSGEGPGGAVPSALREIKVYFSNSELDPEISCTKVFPVIREIEDTPAVARAALIELLKGPNAAEEKRGYFTSINSGVEIRSIAIENGIARVDFTEKMGESAGGSCRVGAIRAQITETLLQFPTVKSVVIAVEGRVDDILQP